MSKTVYGLISQPTTSRTVSVVAQAADLPLGIVGKLVYFDFEADGAVYRSIGTITDSQTRNIQFDERYEGIISRSPDNKLNSPDVRRSNLIVQAVFVRTEDNGTWTQYGSTLPTSPSTSSKIYLLDEEALAEMLPNSDYPSIGYFRGLTSSPLPLNLANFDKSGYHSAVLGRSGSGKTQAYGMILGGYMSHENHAILVIDPQGQWSNENGMIFSPQNFAKSLGREVSILKVAQDIRLTMDSQILARMIEKLDPWRRFRRMGSDQKEAFSSEVSEKISRLSYDSLNVNTREMLTKVFSEIAASNSALSRIYVKGDRQDALADELRLLAGEPYQTENKDGEVAVATAEDIDSAEETWEKLLSVFVPLHNLFTSQNLSGGQRKPLGGNDGFLTKFFQVRTKDDSPAPYVVLDMSPDISLRAKSDMLSGTDSTMQMQKLLDNADIKALILMMVLDEMKHASEVTFSSGEGLLNTQIVFDEAWRYAPERKTSPEIDELANMLEGFALDTRKFGIGWTYILQSPSDLKFGIWRQLTYVYAGYGLVGDDVKRLENLTDDTQQVDLYRQFISPTSTKVYPFMVMGPISPLIFTTAPTFFNAYDGSKEFLENNKNWINAITSRRGLPPTTEAMLKVSVLPSKKATKEHAEKTSHSIGKTYATSQPQTVVKEATRSTPLEETPIRKIIRQEKENKNNNFLPGRETLEETPF